MVSCARVYKKGAPLREAPCDSRIEEKLTYQQELLAELALVVPVLAELLARPDVPEPA
jgi:hypothetical protein